MSLKCVGKLYYHEYLNLLLIFIVFILNFILVKIIQKQKFYFYSWTQSVRHYKNRYMLSADILFTFFMAMPVFNMKLSYSKITRSSHQKHQFSHKKYNKKKLHSNKMSMILFLWNLKFRENSARVKRYFLIIMEST